MFINNRQKLTQPKKANPTARNSGVSKKPTHSAGSLTSVASKTKVGAEKKTLNWDDISISSDDSKDFQRFLKNPVGGVDNAQTKSSKSLQSREESFDRPKTSRGSIDSGSTSRINTSGPTSAVDRLAEIEARFRARKEQHQSRNRVGISSSDFDLDISSDSEVKRDVGKSNVKLRDIVKKKDSSKSFQEKSKNLFMSMADDSSSSDDRSESGMKFVKNNVVLMYSDNEDESDYGGSKHTKKISNAKIKQKLPQRTTPVNVSTDLDDSEKMQAYMEGLDQERRPGSPKKVTFADDLEQSLDDFMQRSDEMSSLDEVAPTKLLNIMSLDDLLPANDNLIEEDVPSSSILMGLQSVDELLPAVDIRSSSEYAPSMDEEIAEGNLSRSSSSDDENKPMFHLRSVEELEVDTESAKPAAARSSVFRAQSPVEKSESEVEEIKSESVSYSEDFHSDDDTLRGTDSISQDISDRLSLHSSGSEASSIPEESYGSDKRKHPYSRSKSSSSYTTSQHSRAPRSATPVEKVAAGKAENVQTQTELMAGPWMPGSIYTDLPSFKPTKLIDNEALDILTSYNPATLAIQDLLQQQVQLTREFVARSQRLHSLAVSSVPCDYVYGDIGQANLERLKRIWENQDRISTS